MTARTSVSALARRIDAEQPTPLLDETDATFGGDKTYAQDLRGLLNAGFRRGGKYTINVASGEKGWVPKDFHVFSPKAFAGIGSLPDTVVSRSITIRLERKRSTEKVEKLRLRRSTALAAPIRTQLERVALQLVETLREITEAGPLMPAGLSDRAEDVWEPLLAIADLAGGRWPERARCAAVELSANRREDEDSHRVQLLRDIRTIFNQRGADRISSTELVNELNAIEDSPWGGWSQGKGLTTHALARQLKPFGIAPRHTRDGSARGYSKEQFEEAFSRYLPLHPAETVKASDATTLGEGQPTSEYRSISDGSDEAHYGHAEHSSDALTLPPADTRRGAAGPAGDEAQEDSLPDDQAYADAEHERLRRKFPDLFRAGS